MVKTNEGPVESNSQFWMNLTAQVAIAIGTIGAVVVALFGGWLRAHLTPPKLTLRLKDERGEKTPVKIMDPNAGSQRESEGRWFHVVVENKRRWSPAREAQVFLLRVEERDASGQDQITWLGDVPLRWRHQEIHPITLTIGSATDCDLCSVVNGKWVELHPLIITVCAQCATARELSYSRHATGQRR